ncbi:C4-dicarboxylate TRAP transporter substrate-binding protein [Paracoccus xiamenensis]|uniref:C4-dicarboxylate TRAP transporter substrate-binding protein n=1 Tax=Paracoccus xiamenensis TaxID=2714901 RepID=UPI00140E5F95|nr:C4-dicarboxylate TRAP transporter substrate-binding protein [Paracoccus xiamenensis]NHF74444.1 C4-dicarboxylate ABC transporter substrate-binding protein [Paracoccus xiamenensis]
MKTAINIAATTALALAAAPLAAETYQASNWMAPAHILNEFPYQMFATDIATASDGAIEFEVYSGGSLLPAANTMQGIADGVAHLGVVYPGYTPSELPLSNVVNDAAFVSDDDIAAAFAWTEMGLTNEQLRAEWSKNGGIFLGGYSTPVYHFICVKEITSPESAVGLKIRTAGGAQASWVEALGAVPVSVPIGDVYSGLERGSIDCTMSDPTNLDKGNKFWEVARSVNKLPMGVVVGATYVASKPFWAGLSTDQRKMLMDHMATGIARQQVAYHVGVQNALQGSTERGLTVSDPAPELVTKLNEFQTDLMEKLPEQEMSERQIDDPTALIEQFLELEAKWKGLLKDVDRTDPEAVAAILRENLYDKIDPDTLGE